jgi:hypothetical protein
LSKHLAKRTSGHVVPELIFSVFLLAAICALRTVQIYASNAGQVAFADLGSSMWIYMGISIAVFSILRIFLRKPYFVCIFVAFGTFLAVNFDLLVGLVRLFVNKYSTAAIGGMALYAVLLVGLFFLLRLLYKKKFPADMLVRVLSVTFSGLVLFNAVMAFVASGKAAAVRAAATAEPVATATATAESLAINPDSASIGKPNVYFFVLDEYSPFEILKKYYGYDNAVFNTFLKLEGFNVSKESYATDNQTEHSGSDLLNLDYISRNLSKDACYKAISNAKLFKIFTGLGYTQAQLSTNNTFFNGIPSLDPNIKPDADNVTLDGEDVGEIVAENSIADAFSSLLGGDANSDTPVDTKALNKWGVYSSDYIRNTKEFKQNKYKNFASNMLKIFDYYENPANYAASAPRVTYTYLMTPHVPFLFNQYGGILPNSQRINWEDTNVYLNQYKFVTKHMMAMISTIIENDPESIIIVMSDHGIRYHADCNLKHTFYVTDKDSCRIMNAVYVKGQKLDIEGLSGVNTLRLIVRLYGLQNYPPINDPINAASPDSLKGIIPKPR